MAKKLKIRDLTLRDGQQSSFATRMSQAQIDRCLPFYKDAKFYAMEVWGGAVPDSVMRYLNENPWTRLETIHKAVGDVSKLTALSRGRNLFGYAPYTDEIIDAVNNDQFKCVPVSITIGHDGSGKNPNVELICNTTLSLEALRVVEKMPKWIPAFKNGKPVATSQNITVYFKVPEK